MKASELVKESSAIIESDGDHEVNISCLKVGDSSEVAREQKYLTAFPSFVVVEGYEHGREISIRDWPY